MLGILTIYKVDESHYYIEYYILILLFSNIS